MKADATQQRCVLELAEIDAELTRIAHRSANLAEHRLVGQLENDERSAEERSAVLGIAIEDLDGQVGRLESEIDGVRQREDRDRALLDASSTGAKQLAELQHELETLTRRQASLEDTLLDVMERREQLQAEQSQQRATVDGLREELTVARKSRDAAAAELENARDEQGQRREKLVAAIGPELMTLYDRVGAGPLQGPRCGACRIEIDRGELARIAAAADDEVLRCPECGAILLRGAR